MRIGFLMSLFTVTCKTRCCDADRISDVVLYSNLQYPVLECGSNFCIVTCNNWCREEVVLLMSDFIVTCNPACCDADRISDIAFHSKLQYPVSECRSDFLRRVS